MNESKVLLFIVEGRTDEVSLAPAMEQIVSRAKVKFKVMRADITADYASSVENIEERIKRLGVKKFLNDNIQIKANDICGVVHSVDLDGAFVPDNVVFQSEVDHAEYYDDKILCKDKTLFLKTKKE